MSAGMGNHDFSRVPAIVEMKAEFDTVDADDFYSNCSDDFSRSPSSDFLGGIYSPVRGVPLRNTRVFDGLAEYIEDSELDSAGSAKWPE